MYPSSVCRQQSHVHEHVELKQIQSKFWPAKVQSTNHGPSLYISDNKKENMETTSESEQLIDYLRVWIYVIYALPPPIFGEMKKFQRPQKHIWLHLPSFILNKEVRSEIWDSKKISFQKMVKKFKKINLCTPLTWIPKKIWPPQFPISKCRWGHCWIVHC